MKNSIKRDFTDLNILIDRKLKKIGKFASIVKTDDFVKYVDLHEWCENMKWGKSDDLNFPFPISYLNNALKLSNKP